MYANAFAPARAGRAGADRSSDPVRNRGVSSQVKIGSAIGAGNGMYDITFEWYPVGSGLTHPCGYGDSCRRYGDSRRRDTLRALHQENTERDRREAADVAQPDRFAEQ